MNGLRAAPTFAQAAHVVDLTAGGWHMRARRFRRTRKEIRRTARVAAIGVPQVISLLWQSFSRFGNPGA
jgi:hypothetical protein